MKKGSITQATTETISKSGPLRAGPSLSTPPTASPSAARVTEIEQCFSRPESRLKPFLQALRLHHWLKNLLVFVPLVLAYRYDEPRLLGNAFLAFLSFGLAASCVYLINDLVDLPADRRHPRKRMRPLASGQLSLLSGLVLAPLLLAASVSPGLHFCPCRSSPCCSCTSF